MNKHYAVIKYEIPNHSIKWLHIVYDCSLVEAANDINDMIDELKLKKPSHRMVVERIDVLGARIN